jgi:hypothetical protein
LDKEQNEKVILHILDVLNIYRGAKFLGGTSDSSLLIRAEWAIMLKNSVSHDWIKLTRALIKSYLDDQAFDDFFSLIITYKTYSDFLLTYRNSKWSITQFLLQDEKVDSFVKNCDWLYTEMKKLNTIGESCAMLSVILGMRVPFIGDLPTSEVKAFSGLLSGVIKTNESLIFQNSLSAKDQLCAFIAAEFFQKKTAYPIDHDMKNHISVTFFIAYNTRRC